MKRIILLLFLLIIAIAIWFPQIKIIKEFINQKMSGKKTVKDRLVEYSVQVDSRLGPIFSVKGVSYPPEEFTLIAIKDEKTLELYSKNANGKQTLICKYPILAASGKLGPKLREGDRQVPEGIYKIESLNPNSLFHLSMKISYPNDFDKKIAAIEGRTNLGGDIMIHGNQVSIGCIAVGDEASEDLFILAARTKLDKINILVTPIDFRKKNYESIFQGLPKWTEELYDQIREELKKYVSEI